MLRSRRLTVILLLATAALVVAAWRMKVVPVQLHPARYRPLTAPFPAGSIAGKVTSPHAKEPRTASAAGPGCPAMTVGSAGGLSETVVALLNIHGGVGIRNTGPKMSLDRCGFQPRVSTGLVGTVASVHVAEGGDHRLEALLGGVRVYDAVATGNSRVALVGEGVWALRCATGHALEQGWIYVSENPYAVVTDAGGGFRLGDVPAGRWKIMAWNPEFGEKTAEVLVETGRETRLNLEL